MESFTPTRGIWATTKNSIRFVRDNLHVFWDIYRHYLPYVFGLYVLGLVVTVGGLYHQGSGVSGFNLAELLISYFTVCLTISWHRAVIWGPSRMVRVNPFALQKQDWQFIGAAIAITMIIFTGGFIAGFISSMAVRRDNIAVVLVAVLMFIALCYFGMRLYFYFPAKAANSDLTFGQAYKLTKGYVWPLLGTCLVSTALIMIPYIVILTVSGIIGHIVGGRLDEGETATALYHVGTFIKDAPEVLILTPLWTVVNVTIISNFYLHALGNGRAWMKS